MFPSEKQKMDHSVILITVEIVTCLPFTLAQMFIYFSVVLNRHCWLVTTSNILFSDFFFQWVLNSYFSHLVSNMYIVFGFLQVLEENVMLCLVIGARTNMKQATDKER